MENPKQASTSEQHGITGTRWIGWALLTILLVFSSSVAQAQERVDFGNDQFGASDPAAEAAAAAMGMGFVLFAVLIGIAIGIAIMAVICYFVAGHFKAIPPNHRTMEPGQVWLMLIPFFNLYWAFKVFPGLSDSFKSYFDSVGNATVGDCGRQVGLWYAICAACSLIPCVNYIAGPASLILLIMFLVKASELKGKMGTAATA